MPADPTPGEPTPSDPAPAEDRAPEVTVRYFAGARSAAGLSSERVAVSDLAGLVDELVARHGADLAKVLDVCSFLVDGLNRRDRYAALAPGATVDVLPPFAGG
jgi:molybdopterin synthase sulfur carrier subunit